MSDRSRSPEYWQKYHHMHGQLIQLQDELIELNKHITLFEQQTKRSLEPLIRSKNIAKSSG